MKITENISGIPAENLFALAERENNPKRRNLLVNLRQAKHFPALPSQALELFGGLGRKIKESLPDGKTLVIAFAETATAVGAAAAAELSGDVYFIHTTRENLPKNMLVADFSEEHSHAASQLLFSLNGTDIFGGIGNVVFIDDEFTTGNTIINFVKAIREFTGICRFYAASLINGMNEENLKRFEKFGVTPLWLVKTEGSAADMEKNLGITAEKDNEVKSRAVEIYTEDYPCDPRLGCDIDGYMKNCREIAERIADKIYVKNAAHGNSISVVGTEECMLPSIILGKVLEERGADARCRSTTRSPIVPSANKSYPLNVRTELKSPYEKGRRTFLYNSYPCGTGIIVTDADFNSADSQSAIEEIAGALEAKRVIAVILKRNNPEKAVLNEF